MATQPMYYGSLYFTTTAVTNNLANTPIKAAGETLGVNCYGFSHSTNRLTYTGNTGRTFAIDCAFSVSCSGATQSIMHLYKNGEAIPGAHIERKIGTGGDIGAGSVIGLVRLKKDDYVELWCETDADADDMTVERGMLRATVAG